MSGTARLAAGEEHGTGGSGLGRILNARSIAVVGASDDLRKAGGRVVDSLLHNAFEGAIYPVNPGREAIQGLRAYPSLEAIGAPVDLAILAVAAEEVANQLRLGIAAGVGGFVVFASGFAEAGADGAVRQEAIARIAREAGVPMIGPNCLGVMNGNRRMLASSTVVMGGRRLPAGSYGCITQSGALGTYWLDMTMKAGLGVSAWISTGNEADVDLSACLDHLVEDEATAVIGLYIEGVRDGATFRRAARKAFLKKKPIMVLKAGRSGEGATAAASHTGALAGEDAVYDALFRQYNIVRCDSLTAMAQQAEMLVAQPRVSGSRVAVISVSGGAGVLMTDAAVAHGLAVPDFGEATKAALREILPDFATPQNPVDLTAQIVMHKTMLRRVLQVVTRQGGYDGLLLFMGGLSQIAEELADALVTELPRHMPCAVTWQAAPQAAVDAVRARGIPVYPEIGDAARALAVQLRLGRGWEATAPAEAVAVAARRSGAFLVEHRSKALLASRGGLARPQGGLASDPDEARVVAAGLAGPFAVKLQSPQMLHKSGSGGIVLGVPDAAGVASAAGTMLAAARGRGLPVEGVLVEQMVPYCHEFIVGLRTDHAFGPMLVIGRGGVTVELEPDVARAFLPLDAHAIAGLVRSLRCAPLFDGFRGAPRCDVDALAQAVARLCRLYLEDESLAEIEINPLVMDESGQVLALDALVACVAEAGAGA